MDTWVEQRWYGEKAQQTYDDIVAALRTLERKLSLYLPDSEIARLNAEAGKNAVVLSEDVYDLLRDARQFGEETEGLFDVTVAPLTLCWNVTGENPQVPSAEEVERARVLVDYRRLVLDDETHSAFLPQEGMSVDLGGIAKGMAASAMRTIVEQNGVEGYLSIGGNMLVVGKKPDGSDFRIGIRDPRGDASALLAVVDLEGLTMATTGDYERYFEQDGVRYHHVLDPRTGYPADGGLISVTVISADGTLADCLSTGIFLAGKQGLDRYLERTDCMVLAVTDMREVYLSDALWERLSEDGLSEDYSFHKGRGS